MSIISRITYVVYNMEFSKLKCPKSAMPNDYRIDYEFCYLFRNLVGKTIHSECGMSTGQAFLYQTSTKTDFRELSQGLTWFLVIFWSIYRDSLPISAPFEIFGMIFLAMIAKALIIATKYGFKSDLLVNRGIPESMYSKGYADTQQRDKGQMATYIFNLSVGAKGEDNQKGELIKLLYKSSLISNTDLSCASFSWHAATGKAGRGDGGGVALQVWEAMLEITKGVDEKSLFDETDLDHSGAITLDEMLARAQAALGSDFDADAVREEFGRLDANHDQKLSIEEMQSRSVSFSNHLMFNARNGLLRRLLREDDLTLHQRVEAGELPASVLAVLLVIECSHIPRKVGLKYVLWMVMLPAVVVTVLPLIIRGALSLPGWGSTWQEYVLYGMSLWLMFFTAAPLLLYFVCPCVWLYRQLSMCKRLLALISPPKGMGVVWNPPPQTYASSSTSTITFNQIRNKPKVEILKSHLPVKITK